MKIPLTMYETARIKLVPFEREIIKNSKYTSWFYNQNVTKYNSHGLFQMTNGDIENYFKLIDTHKILVFAIFWKNSNLQNNIHIGNISLQGFNWINRSAEFAVLIGEEAYWGKGVTTEAALLLFEHGFNKLNLHRIWSGTACTNKGMIKVFEKLGMNHEGTFREALFLENNYINCVEYAILKKEYEKLQTKPNKKKGK